MGTDTGQDRDRAKPAKGCVICLSLSRLQNIRFALLAILLSAISGLTHAQSAPAAQTATEGPSEGLGEIVVTARRYSENLQNVPISVSAVSGAELAARGMVQTTDLAASVPNLQINSEYGDTQPNFTLRGVGVANEYNTNTASPIGVYDDDVYQAFRFTHGLQLYDMDRIEVLRGPQGTLFGRNTTGGAVSIYSREPTLDGESGYFQVGYGNYDRFHTEGAAEFTPVAAEVGVRLAYTFTDSFGDGPFNEVDPQNSSNNYKHYDTTDNVGLRLTAVLKPADGLKIALKAYYSNDNPIGVPIVALGLVGGVGGTDLFGYSRQANGLAYNQHQLDTQDHYYVRTIGSAVNITYTLNDQFSLASVTGYSKSRVNLRLDNDGTSQNLFDDRYTTYASDFSEDARVNLENQLLQALVGAYYGRDTAEALNNIFAYDIFPNATSIATFNPGGSVNPAAPPTSLNAQYGYDQIRSTVAVYGEGTHHVLEKLDLTLGARYSYDWLDFNNAFSNFYGDYPGPVILPAYAPFSQKNTEGNFSGRAILAYAWTDDIRTYVSYSKGYRAGTYNGFGYSSKSQIYFLPAEKLQSIEVGIKTRFLDNKLQINAALFHYDYKNQQVQEIVGAVGFLRSLNAKVEGGEAEILARPFSRLTLRSSVGYVNSRYDDNQALSGVDVGGNRVPFASRWTGDAGGDWTLFQADKSSAVLSADAHYVSKFFYDPFNDKQPGSQNLLLQPGAGNLLSQGGYVLMNARLNLNYAQFTVGCWVKNLANKQYYPAGYDVTGAFGSVIYVPGTPRTYGADVTYKF